MSRKTSFKNPNKMDKPDQKSSKRGTDAAAYNLKKDMTRTTSSRRLDSRRNNAGSTTPRRVDTASSKTHISKLLSLVSSEVCTAGTALNAHRMNVAIATDRGTLEGSLSNRAFESETERAQKKYKIGQEFSKKYSLKGNEQPRLCRPP